MSEVHFYHLQRQPLERVLPLLIEKCLERGWNCVVEAPSRERVESLDQHLWTYDDASFLPHGTEWEPDPSRHPVVLTTGPANPNAAKVRFLIDRADLADAANYVRVIRIFDGTDESQVEQARADWRAVRRDGHEVAYWQQDDSGRWSRRGGRD
ncbi:DNA polymerase III subunit chi [Ancylobacter terrae]|uniref:DNA polymerase III subunit chi n=1 Tax=Ancylobacter sp. sgz301288 TaxID=3342077 RepID=UPI00385EF5C2